MGQILVIDYFTFLLFPIIYCSLKYLNNPTFDGFNNFIILKLLPIQ